MQRPITTLLAEVNKLQRLGILTLCLVSLIACESAIKKEGKPLVEEGTEVVEAAESETESLKEEVITEFQTGVLYSGYSELLGTEFKNIWEEEEFYNHVIDYSEYIKFSLKISRQTHDSIFGSSIFQGKIRPFSGKYFKDGEDLTIYAFENGGIGDEGSLELTLSGDTLKGRWEAYDEVNNLNRSFVLFKTEFKYDPNFLLNENSFYIDWKTFMDTSYLFEEDTMTYVFDAREYATITEDVVLYNASNQKLNKKDVENMKKADLRILRNSIYARHGYAFNSVPLLYYFSQQKWYVPQSINITKELTQLEKDNIKLLLTYEEHAENYYEQFGR